MDSALQVFAVGKPLADNFSIILQSKQPYLLFVLLILAFDKLRNHVCINHHLHQFGVQVVLGSAFVKQTFNLCEIIAGAAGRLIKVGFPAFAVPNKLPVVFVKQNLQLVNGVG
jgi:hypothetical protein